MHSGHGIGLMNYLTVRGVGHGGVQSRAVHTLGLEHLLRRFVLAALFAVTSRARSKRDNRNYET